MNKKELNELSKKEEQDKIVKDVSKDLKVKKEHHSIVEEEQIIEDKLNNEILDLKDKISNNKKWYIVACVIAGVIGLTFALLLGFKVI